jgi:signal transduction histidine kinase
MTSSEAVGRCTGAVRDASRGQALAELAVLAHQLEAAVARLGETGDEVASDESRRELVAWLSDDLRPPLAGIRALIALLADGTVNDAAIVARCHRRLTRETERLSALVDDLLELSRVQADTALDHDHRDAAVSVREVSRVIPGPGPSRGFDLAYRAEAARHPCDGGDVAVHRPLAGSRR